MEYKQSFYNFIFENNGNFYIYNTLSTAIAELDKDTYESFTCNNANKIQNKEIKNSLIEEGFLVPHNADEKLYYKHFFDNLRFGVGAKVFSLIIVPTYDCNLRCPYCYEGNDKKKDKISKEQIDIIYKFIENKLSESKDTIPIKKIRVLMYGGEPLLCTNELCYLCEKISKISEENHLETEYEMVSNLTLLNNTAISLINKYQIMTQVSIDGTKEEHNKRRIYENGNGTYDLIISNLQKLLDNGLKKLITIRVNIDEANVINAEQIFKDLKPYSDDIYFGFLTSYKGFNENYEHTCIEENSIASLSAHKLHKIFDDNGYEVPQRFGKKSPCAINSENKFIIDNKLDVYKCEMLINQPECRVGTLNTDGELLLEPNFYQQMSFSPFLFEECRECKFLPLCGAGCPAKVYINSGNKNGNVLMKNCSFDENALKEYLIEHISRM